MLPRNLAPIYAGHDAGHYQLPAELLAPRQALLALVEARGAASAERNAAEAASAQARSAAAGALLAAATAGAPLPDPAGPILDAKTRHEAATVAVQAYADAAARGELALRATLTRCRDEIITKALAPALEEVVAEVEAIAAALAGLDLTNAEEVMRTPARVEAYQRLQAAHRRELAIRATQRGLYGLSTPGRLHGRAEIRNVGAARVPHGVTGAVRLLALVTGGAVLWVPTPAQLAAAEKRRAPGEPGGPGSRVQVPGGLVGHRAVGELMEADV